MVLRAEEADGKTPVTESQLFGDEWHPFGDRWITPVPGPVT
jgi:hypothetical protein